MHRRSFPATRGQQTWTLPRPREPRTRRAAPREGCTASSARRAAGSLRPVRDLEARRDPGREGPPFTTTTTDARRRRLLLLLRPPSSAGTGSGAGQGWDFDTSTSRPQTGRRFAPPLTTGSRLWTCCARSSHSPARPPEKEREAGTESISSKRMYGELGKASTEVVWTYGKDPVWTSPRSFFSGRRDGTSATCRATLTGCTHPFLSGRRIFPSLCMAPERLESSHLDWAKHSSADPSSTPSLP